MRKYRYLITQWNDQTPTIELTDAEVVEFNSLRTPLGKAMLIEERAGRISYDVVGVEIIEVKNER